MNKTKRGFCRTELQKEDIVYKLFALNRKTLLIKSEVLFSVLHIGSSLT